MKQYIDKAAVVAEIEKRKKHNKEWLNWCIENKTSIIAASQAIQEDKDIMSLIDTLEVKEVDLEKEIKLYKMRNPIIGHREGSLNNYMSKVAKHFFELGLKAKQETNDEVKIGETQIYLEDDGGEPPYDGKQWLDLSCTEYMIPKTLFKDGDNVEIFIRKAQKGE